MQRITGIDNGSIAEELGVRAGDFLTAINGQPVLDVVDYEFLCAQEHLILSFLHPDEGEYTADIEKDDFEGLGLQFESGLMSPMRTCKNKCIFCFIDQMPRGGRETLQVKDDDWRMSFIMGNYISLTNVDDAEFARICERKVSPLYISVHATDPAVRVAMMRNPQAGRILERLRALKDAGLRFHCQIVCCPGVNDGAMLQKTLEDLFALYPAAQSVAVVPVGLTKFRASLFPLHGFSKEEAQSTCRQVQVFAEQCLRQAGTRFVFPADELVLLEGEELPAYETYEDFAQIENGVGLLRLYEQEFMDALQEKQPLKTLLTLDAVGGMAAHSFFCTLFERLKPYNIDVHVHAIRNDYFGPTVTVGGLVTAEDIIAQLQGKQMSGTLLIPHNMLREQEDVFLDGMTVDELAACLNVRVAVVRGDGDDCIRTIFACAER
ncbi:DUF512 domain-containing protein [Christensenellaceae bacterium OttesenSCG-928-L17]|nr:DUF512 domain-containing protein [Christensenellaceae bacterium OttesenSCG-928-L17]